jgi:hypothetical protein
MAVARSTYGITRIIMCSQPHIGGRVMQNLAKIAMSMSALGHEPPDSRNQMSAFGVRVQPIDATPSNLARGGGVTTYRCLSAA